MTGDLPTRRATRLSNRMIALGLAVIAVLAYVLIALRIRYGMQ
jgi:hypothetical protein